VIAYEDKAERANELVIANKELAFQNEEKEKRLAVLIIANKETPNGWKRSNTSNPSI
jgi:hypothetical protein